MKPKSQETEPTVPSPEPASSLVDRYLRHLDALLQDPETGAMGAYAMGLVTGMARKFGRLPSRELLERASRCKTIADVSRVTGERLTYSE